MKGRENMKLDKQVVRRIAAASIAAVMAASAAVCADSGAITAYAAMDSSEFAAGYSHPTQMRGLTAFQLVSDMGAGWNLGNSLDSADSETNWGNPRTTKAMIDAIAAEGYTTLRVPVRWDDYYSDPSTYKIRDDYMDRVETVVNYGLANDMYVIMNVHHNDIQTMFTPANSDRVCEELTALWTQISARFKDYGDKLIFEVINEPRDNEDWNGRSELFDCVNKGNAAGLAAIRASGGNNAKRLVMLPTYCASADAAKTSAWQKPAGDNMVAVSIHAYLPFDFAFDGGGHTDWRDSDYSSLKSVFERLNSTFISKGVPVVIGEFGATNKGNLADRVIYADKYVSLARQFPEQDIPCVWWDNNSTAGSTGGEKFGIFDRGSATFTYKEIADSMIAAYKSDVGGETGSSGEKILSSGGSCDSWGQAAKMDSAVLSDIKQYGTVKVDYSSSNPPEMIIQSGSVAWCKIAPSSNDGSTAEWTYDHIKSVYEAAGGDISDLDDIMWVYVGDTGAGLTISKVYVPTGAAHTHSFDGEETITLAPTALTEGKKRVNCSVPGCSAYKMVTIPAGGDPVDPDPVDPVDPDPVDPVDPVDDELINAFVDRLYKKFFDRVPTVEEKQGHITIVKTMTAAKDVENFIWSPEFTNRNVTNEEFVNIMYNVFFDRDAGTEGQGWVDALYNGCSRDRIFWGFIGAGEFAELCSEAGIRVGTVTLTQNRDKNPEVTKFVMQLYKNALDEPNPNEAGLNDWTGLIVNKTNTPAEVAHGIIFSPQFTATYSTNEAFVNQLYLALFGRSAAEGENAGWLEAMAEGSTREDVFEGFIGSLECVNYFNSFNI